MKNQEIHIDKYSLIIINCLKESNDIEVSLKQLKKFKDEFTKLNTNYKYVYLLMNQMKFKEPTIEKLNSKWKCCYQ